GREGSHRAWRVRDGVVGAPAGADGGGPGARGSEEAHSRGRRAARGQRPDPVGRPRPAERRTVPGRAAEGRAPRTRRRLLRRRAAAAAAMKAMRGRLVRRSASHGKGGGMAVMEKVTRVDDDATVVAAKRAQAIAMDGLRGSEERYSAAQAVKRDV